MFKWLKYIHQVRQIDRLCFKKGAGIRLKLCGSPGYDNQAKEFGDSPEKEHYTIPIFFHYNRPGLLPLAIHEVRHRVQWNNPEMYLLTDKDIPEELLPYYRPDVAKKLGPREIDAEIIEQISLPLFLSNQISAFLELMLGKAKPSKES